MGRVRIAQLCAGLVALAIVAYLPLWNNDFVDFDDEVYITENPAVAGGLTWSGLCWAWTNDEAPYWLPLTWLSLQFDAHFFSTLGPRGEVVLSPAAFHGHNLFWHVATALLLFAVWHRLTGARWRSFFVAALFAVHPMHVESVAWAAERKDVLSGFFGTLTLWAYLRYRERPGWARYGSMLAAFLLSLLAKPMLITLPFVLLLLDYWPLRRMGPQLGRLVLEKLPMFVLAGVIAAITLESRERHGALVALSTISLSARLANALTAYGWYVGATFCPVQLAVLYPHPYGDWSPLAALAGAGLLSSLTALALWQARRRPWLIVGWLWFVGALFPVIGLAQGGAQAWADRFSYWPHIGLFAAIVWGLGELVDRFHVPAWAPAMAAAAVLACFTVLTWCQVGYWRDSVTLWERALAVTKHNPQAHQRLSLSYRKLGRIEEADLHLKQAYRIQFARLQRHKPGPRTEAGRTTPP
jgi:hypothetical protein